MPHVSQLLIVNCDFSALFLVQVSNYSEDTISYCYFLQITSTTNFTVTGRGLFQFKRMHYGLSNDPRIFQHLIDDNIDPTLETDLFKYLDDIIIATSNFEKLR